MPRFEMLAVLLEQFSLIFLDLDHFKGINDSFGHAMYDAKAGGIAGVRGFVVPA